MVEEEIEGSEACISLSPMPDSLVLLSPSLIQSNSKIWYLEQQMSFYSSSLVVSQIQRSKKKERSIWSSQLSLHNINPLPNIKD